MGINSVCIQGRIGQDPDMKRFDKGALFRASIAVDGYNFSKKEKETYWVNVKVWGHNAEYLFDTLQAQKGDSLIVQGMLKTETFQDKTGQERTVTLVEVGREGNVSLIKKQGGTQGSRKQHPASYEDF